MKTILILLTILCLPVMAFAGDKTIKGEIRDPSGKMLFKTSTRGAVTETRDPMGKLITKSRTRNGTTEVRSPTGKLLFKTK
jgi:hypothetical protein